jgi:hypothetical protein
MTNERLRKEKRIFADKKRILAALNRAADGMVFSAIAAQLPISRLRLKGLLISLLKSNDVFHNDGVWVVHKKPILSFRKQEPLYPDFDKEHEEWQKQILEKKQLRQKRLGK